MKTPASRSAEIRGRLDYPVIDADGHMIEFEAGVLDYLEEVGGRRLVEKGLIDEKDFRDFVFANPATFYASTNPGFFTGTVVENDVKLEIG